MKYYVFSWVYRSLFGICLKNTYESWRLTKGSSTDYIQTVPLNSVINLIVLMHCVLLQIAVLLQHRRLFEKTQKFFPRKIWGFSWNFLQNRNDSAFLSIKPGRITRRKLQCFFEKTTFVAKDLQFVVFLDCILSRRTKKIRTSRVSQKRVTLKSIPLVTT